MNILICDADYDLTKKLSVALREHNISSSVVSKGKDAQLKLFQTPSEILVIDIETKAHSAIEVIKYVRLNHLKTKVFLSFRDEDHMKQMEMDQELIAKMGVDHVFLKTDGFDEMVNLIISDDELKDAFADYKGEAEIEAEIFEMSVMDGTDLMIGSTAFMDYYVFEGGKKYKRILEQGEQMNTIWGQTVFYRNKDRFLYIQFMNSVLQKVSALETITAQDKMTAMKSLSEQYISETYLKGISPKLINEGRKICESMFTMIEKDTNLREALKNYQDKDPSHFSRIFIVTFFSALISKSLPWSTKRTTEMVAMGALLCDIGLSPEEFSDYHIDYKAYTPEQKKEHEAHARRGADMLRNLGGIPEPVIQIVHQHHELVNGEGFPNQLNGIHIYPLAKIVSLASGFTALMLKENLTPIQTISEFIQNRANLERYEPDMIKALIKSFIKDKASAA